MKINVEEYTRLCEEAYKALNGDYIEFDGMNCNDYSDRESDCPGWDGSERRCACGNRRVSWEVDDEGTGVRAVAW